MEKILGLDTDNQSVVSDNDGDMADLYSQKERGKLHEVVQQSSPKGSKRKHKRVVSRSNSLYGARNLLVEGHNDIQSALRKESFSEMKSPRQINDPSRTGRYQSLRSWMLHECSKNTLQPCEKALIPIISDIGITERFRRQFDKSQLLMAFEKADRDGSGFLEPKELEMLIQGELLQDMSNKNAKVNRVIHDVVSRTIRYFSSHHHTEKIAFIDFLAIFDDIRAELRVPDVIYISLDMTEGENKNALVNHKGQFVMVNAERSKVGWALSIDHMVKREATKETKESKNTSETKETKETKEKKLTWNQKKRKKAQEIENEKKRQMCVLVTDMTNPSRGQAVLRSNVCVMADMELIIEVTNYRNDVYTLPRKPLGEKIYLPLKTVQFRVSPGGDKELSYTQPIYVYMGVEAQEERIDYANCLTITRTHQQLDHALDGFATAATLMSKTQKAALNAHKSKMKQSRRSSFIECEAHRPER